MIHHGNGGLYFNGARNVFYLKNLKIRERPWDGENTITVYSVKPKSLII